MTDTPEAPDTPEALSPLAPRVLVSVITGRRPALKDRTTHLFFEALEAGGYTDIEWVIREDHVSEYEVEEPHHPFNIYPVEWADEYARTHWKHPTVHWESGGFHGAAPGREWAMRTAEARGYDLVLQMDDNVRCIGMIDCTRSISRRVLTVVDVIDLLRDLAWSTNAMMLGLQINSVTPSEKHVERLIRPGYPYSVFMERTGPGRMPWVGPLEDDIMHAIEYATRGGPHRTAALLPLFRYGKVPGGATGMRAKYDSKRGLGLVKHYPANARLTVSSRSSSPVERQRGVRHILSTRGFTPVRVTDPDLFTDAASRAEGYLREYKAKEHVYNLEKIRQRGEGRGFAR